MTRYSTSFLLNQAVRVEDKGNKTQKAVQGVPAEGVIDSGADITVMGANLSKVWPLQPG